MRLRNIAGSRERIESSPYCIGAPQAHKGRWNRVFGNDNPIHIEAGMGKGSFIMRMSEKHPEINFIGIEMYSSVLVRAVERAEQLEKSGEARKNFVFLRMDARELPEVFDSREIEKIYLNFSDPWPKERHAKRRLTSGGFLKKYEAVLVEGGTVEFKTDNKGLFEFSLEEIEKAGWRVLSCTNDLHNDARLSRGNIMTEYEERFVAKGMPINMCIIQKP